MIVREFAQMIAPENASKPTVEGADGGSSQNTDLPFRIELWDENRAAIECVLARAHSATLAEAVFRSACEQYPGRRLSLCRGSERLAEQG